MLIPAEDGGEGTQINFSQRMQGGPDLSLLPNHNYRLGRNSQDFVCRSQERGKVIHQRLQSSSPPMYLPKPGQSQIYGQTQPQKGSVGACSCSMTRCMAIFAWTPSL